MDDRFANIKLSLDGDQYCALIGCNLQEGIAGFGNSPSEALSMLAVEVAKEKTKIQEETDAKNIFNALVELTWNK